MQPVKHPETDKPSMFMRYFWANLTCYGFFGLVCFLTFLSCGRVWDDVMADTAKFFLLLCGGFTLVSVMDAFYTRYYGDPGEGG